ncbi:hypothetical protein ACP70R_016158 [Stipagrostis hirtigluma subsp. patula]
MGDGGKSMHPSLCPPRHGHAPNEAPPTSWVLLDLHAYIADRENATSACAMASNGKAIRVTFCAAPQPLVSYLCVWSPDVKIAIEPTVEAAEDDLVFLRVPILGPPAHREFFVYKATGGEGPSLRLLEDLIPSLPQRHNYTLVAVGERPPAVDDGDDYCIAALNQQSARHPGKFELSLFDSRCPKWTNTLVSLDGIPFHITAKVISLGGGLLGFVDPWRGIIVCDVRGRKPARYLPLPCELVRFDTMGYEPLLRRDVALVRGRLTVVELCGEIIPDHPTSWKVSTWSRMVTDDWEEDWRMDRMFHSYNITVDSNTKYAELLPQLKDNEGEHRPDLGKLYTAHSTLSLSDENVVYIMGKINLSDKKALVLSIDMEIPRVQEVAVFDAERMFGVFSYTYTQSRISGYFNMAAGAGVKENPKRPGKFPMLYPRKLQDTGASKGAKDDDNSMALD